MNMSEPENGDAPGDEPGGQSDRVMSAGEWESVDTSAYDAKWRAMAAAGHNPHGEVDFVERFDPATVLDAGCGTGRVAIELVERGRHAVGIDRDEPMIAAARAKAPDITFHLADLADPAGCDAISEQFEVIVAAGNVMIFLTAGTEAITLQNLARRLEPGGRLIAGFQLGRGLRFDTYDEVANDAGLVLEERWASWDGDPAGGDDTYVVAVHRLPAS